jgi:hypothetical protein
MTPPPMMTASNCSIDTVMKTVVSFQLSELTIETDNWQLFSGGRRAFRPLLAVLLAHFAGIIQVIVGMLDLSVNA